MKHLLIPGILSFAAGAFLSSRSGGAALRNSMMQGETTRMSRATKASVAPTEFTAEQRFSHVLSALQETSFLKQRHDLCDAIGSLGASEIAEMMQRAKRLPLDYRYRVTTALIERWLELDTEAAVAWVRMQPDATIYWNAIARIRPESAIAEVHANPNLRSARWTMELAITAMVGAEKKAQAAKLVTLPADGTRDQLLLKVLADLAKIDAVEAFAFARTLPAGALRNRGTESALRELAKADPQRAMKEVTALLTELTPGLMGSDVVAGVAESMAAKDPQATMRWLSELPEKQRGLGSHIAAAGAWAKTTPIAALSWCEANGIDPARSATTAYSVVESAMGGHPLETMQWIESLPDQAERDRLVETALRARSKLTSPPVAPENVEIVIGLLHQLPLDAQERAAHQLGWISGDRGNIEDVRVWTERLGEESVQAAAIEAAVRYRFRANPNNREQLLEQFSAGMERDAALRGIVAQERVSQPDNAVKTAMEIGDIGKRQEVLDDIIPDWLAQKPAEARAWLANTTLIPPEWAAAWLRENLRPP